MPSSIQVQQSITIGQATIIESPSPTSQFAVVFKDDGWLGYFYAQDLTRKDNHTCDGLHIYNANSFPDADKPATLQIAWSEDGTKAVLVINRYPHAVFDFSARRGYCRTNFPAPNPNWTSYGHEWDDSAIDLFR